MRDRRLLAALVVAYVVALGVLLAGPWGWQLNRLTVRLYVFFRHDLPIAPDSVSPDDYGVLLNVLLFVPIGALLALAMRGAWWWATLVAALLSTAAELTQWQWLERQGQWQDVVANTVGALLGAWAVSRLGRARRGSAPGPVPPRHP